MCFCWLFQCALNPTRLQMDKRTKILHEIQKQLLCKSADTLILCLVRRLWIKEQDKSSDTNNSHLSATANKAKHCFNRWGIQNQREHHIIETKTKKTKLTQTRLKRCRNRFVIIYFPCIYAHQIAYTRTNVMIDLIWTRQGNRLYHSATSSTLRVKELNSM